MWSKWYVLAVYVKFMGHLQSLLQHKELEKHAQNLSNFIMTKSIPSVMYKPVSYMFKI